MNPEEKRLLEETHALAKDNHHLLRAVRRHQLIAAFWRIALWAAVVLATLYAYQFYLRPLAQKYQAMTGSATSGPFGLPTTTDVQKLINSHGAGQ